MPNVKRPIPNYPTDEKKDLLNNTNVQTYPEYKNSTENYYQPTGYKKALELNEQKVGEFESLTGDVISSKNLERNNMVPFFGSKITQQGVDKGFEGLLDIYTGTGSQQNKKEGIAPMFKPESNLTHVRGAPVATSFYQDRMKNVLTTKMNNVKPWQEIQVGPWLQEKVILVKVLEVLTPVWRLETTLPKNIDELRVATNPKVTYGGQVLGAYAGKGGCKPGNSTTHGKLEKNRPDTYYENGADRWFTTTGLEKAQKARSAVILQPENRTTTTREYFGSGKDREGNGTYQPGHFRKTHKQQLAGPELGGASAPDTWGATNKDYGKDGYKNRPNARTFTSERSEMGIVSGVVNALTAPLLDVVDS